MRCRISRCRLSLVVILLAVVTLSLRMAIPAAAASSGPKPIVDAGQPDLVERARRVPLHTGLRLENLFLDQLGQVNLELERFRVFSSDSRISGLRSDRRPPQNAYLRGTLEGLPGSLAVLSFRERGSVGGLVLINGDYWKIESRTGEGNLRSRKVDLSQDFEGEPFECLADGLPGASGVQSKIVSSKIVGPEAMGLGSASYAARVAVETDWEFLDLFGGDEQAATDYVGDLFAFSSSIYEAEVDTSLEISYLNFWPGTASDDPWTPATATNQLYEFRDYWNANHTGTSAPSATC